MKSIIKMNQPQDLLSGFMYPSMINNSLQSVWGEWPISQEKNSPSINIYETPEFFMLEMLAAGFQKEDFKINVEANKLVISGEHKEQIKQEEKKYSRREFNLEPFKRSFILSETADSNNIEAAYNAGILTVKIPKKSETKYQREINIS
jgi:HSP20 family protein